MSACCNLRSCSPLKTVFNKLGDTYQAYCNTYKTHTKAIYQEVQNNLWIGTLPHMDGQDIDFPNEYHHEDMDNFENAEQENNTNLKTLT